MASCKTNPSFAVCGQPISCGQGTVQSCASADGSRCSFRNSDGSSVECASCGNCGDAQQQVASWCGGVPIGLGGGGAGSGGGAGGGGAGGGGAGGGGAGGGSGGGGSGGTTQSLVCQQYLACAAVAAPATFPQLVPVYGPSGSCWTDAALAASCTQACQRSLDDLAATSAAPECHAASTDMAQPSPHDLAQPPPRDMSAPPGSDLACLVFGYQCNGDPTCCSQCCAGGCVTFGYCAL